MIWNALTSLTTLEELWETSVDTPVLLFKHSTRCSISTTALDRMLRQWKTEDSQKVLPYYLDLLNYRPISSAIAERTGVEHQSPQLLLLKNKQVVWTASHWDIDYSELWKYV
ncbi:MAG: bacillithiol system redox-active protein YtxJ [Cytophagaceae bacterium]|jgi:bacillithiol system protein YtxJ|nr:bacillithiol system redox-active protein YtxJ [Cytophagaceae bacterium]